jgi:hypothetical protein
MVDSNTRASYIQVPTDLSFALTYVHALINIDFICQQALIIRLTVHLWVPILQVECQDSKLMQIQVGNDIYKHLDSI